ncbi:MAG: alcohol dehydrogenase catalytic domain-containing protein [Thermodesulfobacteriota bacterium]
MKAAICKKPFELSIEEVPMPVPQSDELLIQVKASAICGSDIKAYEGKHPLIQLPIILGHEFSGVIVEKGNRVDGFRVGDRVVVEPSFVCGQCFFCQRMEYYLCKNLKQLGHQLPGSFAEYTISKARFTYRLANTIPFDKAALVQPLAISIHAVDRAGIRKGQFVVILGMGPIGLLLLQVARQMGANVFVSDLVDFKLEKAKALGAQRVSNGSTPHLIDEIRGWTNGLGADVVIEAAGTSTTVRQSLSAVRRGGTILLLGITGHQKEEVHLERATLDELNLLGTVRYGMGDFPRAIEMIHQETVDLDTLILRRFALTETPRIFEELVRFPERVLRSVMIA